MEKMPNHAMGGQAYQGPHWAGWPKATLGRVTLAALLVASPVAFTCAVAKDLKAISDEIIGGLPLPESVACDANGKALYASLFVSAPKPAEKDGKGKITKLSLTGKVLED
jgi:hypothetical protein